MKMTKKKFALLSAMLIAAPVVLGAGYYGMNYSEPLEKDDFNKISDYERIEEEVTVRLGASIATRENEDGTISYIYSVESMKNEGDESITVDSPIVFYYDESLSETPKSIPKSGTLVMETAKVNFGGAKGNLLDSSLKELNTPTVINNPVSLVLEDNSWENSIQYNWENGSYMNKDSIDEDYERYMTTYETIKHYSIKNTIKAVGIAEIVVLGSCVVLAFLLFKKRKE